MYDPGEDGWKTSESLGFPTGLGALWTKREARRWICGLAIEAAHMNGAGVAHGGVLMALLDHALALEVWEAAGRTTCVTVQLNTHFLRGVPAGCFLVGRGETVRTTRSLVFARGTLGVAGEEPAASADGVWKRLAPRG